MGSKARMELCQLWSWPGSPEPAKPGPGQLPWYRGAGTGWHRRAQAVTIAAGPVRHQPKGEWAAWGFRGSRGSWLDCWAPGTKGLGDSWGREGGERDSNTRQGLLGSGPLHRASQNTEGTLHNAASGTPSSGPRICLPRPSGDVSTEACFRAGGGRKGSLESS